MATDPENPNVELGMATEVAISEGISHESKEIMANTAGEETPLDDSSVMLSVSKPETESDTITSMAPLIGNCNTSEANQITAVSSTVTQATINESMTDSSSLVMPTAAAAISPATDSSQMIKTTSATELTVTPKVTSTKRNRANKRTKGGSTSDVARNLCVRFEGNQSKRWDGKEVLIDYDWIKEEVDATQLLPGSTINIPWPIKGGEIQNWKGIVVNIDDASVSQSHTSNTKKKARGSNCKPKQSNEKNESKGKGT